MIFCRTITSLCLIATTGLTFALAPSSDQALKIQKQKQVICYRFTNAVIVSQSYAKNGGESILIKPSQANCQFKVTPTSWLYPSRTTQDSEPSYFLGLSNGYLLIDAGTGPDLRKLSLINLANHQLAFTTDYREIKTIHHHQLQVWRPLTHPAANRSNCPNFNQISALSLTPVIEELISIDLRQPQLKATPLQQQRCNQYQ